VFDTDFFPEHDHHRCDDLSRLRPIHVLIVDDRIARKRVPPSALSLSWPLDDETGLARAFSHMAPESVHQGGNCNFVWFLIVYDDHL
jgi:hypothetical protein